MEYENLNDIGLLGYFSIMWCQVRHMTEYHSKDIQTITLFHSKVHVNKLFHLFKNESYRVARMRTFDAYRLHFPCTLIFGIPFNSYKT